MVRFSKNLEDFALLLKEKEFKELGLDETKEFDLIKVQKDIWLLVERGKKEEAEAKQEDSKFRKIDEKIFNLIKTKPLRDRVEKRFETFLKKEELERFKQLLKEGKIIPFKLSDKYKRAVYKLKQDIEQQKKSSSEDFDSDFERKGFALMEEPNVRIFSEKNYERIKRGEIIGIRGFDKKFYLIERKLFEEWSEKILKYLMQNKSALLEEIAEDNHVSQELVRIVCELLKEKGDIFEKTKGQYNYIE